MLFSPQIYITKPCKLIFCDPIWQIIAIRILLLVVIAKGQIIIRWRCWVSSATVGASNAKSLNRVFVLLPVKLIENHKKCGVSHFDTFKSNRISILTSIYDRPVHSGSKVFIRLAHLWFKLPIGQVRVPRIYSMWLANLTISELLSTGCMERKCDENKIWIKM